MSAETFPLWIGIGIAIAGILLEMIVLLLAFIWAFAKIKAGVEMSIQKAITEFSVASTRISTQVSGIAADVHRASDTIVKVQEIQTRHGEEIAVLRDRTGVDET